MEKVGLLMSNLEIVDTDIDEFLEEYNFREENHSRHLNFDGPRRKVLLSWKDAQACPGSGKTTLVAAKLLILSKKWTAKHRGICVLTHTNVACDEIRERLQKHPAGNKLIAYPHFIGTIQEFVNKFLALTYLKSSGLSPVRVDDDASVNFMSRMINIGTENYLERKRGSLYDLKINHRDGSVNIPVFNNTSTSNTYKDLERALDSRKNNGLFFYSEMYHFAKKCLSENESLLHAVQKRFSIVLVDEMQDTQKFQDELINLIFDCDDVKLQRLGDPDQAIFDNMGGEPPNESFNSNSDLEPIKSTHRFARDIAHKISGLSLTQKGEIEALREAPNDQVPHTILVYGDANKRDVLDRFSRIIEECDPEQKWTCIKAVGATEGEGGFISEYWSGYNRRKLVKRPKPEKLIHLVQREWWTVQSHSFFQYSLLMQGVVDALRLSDKKDIRSDPPKYFSAMTLSSWLIDNDKHEPFRKLLTSWIYSPSPDSGQWIVQVAELRELLCITSAEDPITNFLSYDGMVNVKNGEIYSSNNIFQATNGREIEVATIHAVKGETHDATLVLETKNYQYDLELLLDHIAFLDTSRISAIRKSKFARQLYVAASRPRNLLCFTVHEGHLSQSQRTALEGIGWNISLP